VGHMPEISIKTLALNVLGESKPVPVGKSTKTQFAAPMNERPSLEPAVGRETCWHCGGSGECDCSTCGVMKALTIWAPGECVPCKAQKTRVQ
jgi:hypothetical protein